MNRLLFELPQVEPWLDPASLSVAAACIPPCCAETGEFSNKEAQRLVKCGFHHDFISCCHDHAFQLREICAFRFEIERNHIEEGVFNRDHDKLAANHSRSLLVPQRELLRNKSCSDRSLH